MKEARILKKNILLPCSKDKERFFSVRLFVRAGNEEAYPLISKENV